MVRVQAVQIGGERPRTFILIYKVNISLQSMLVGSSVALLLMSAYGALKPVAENKEPLPLTVYALRPRQSTQATPSTLNTPSASWTHIAVYHLTLARTPKELLAVLYAEFAAELERDIARTYPQEAGMTEEEFKAYFFARDVFVGVGLVEINVPRDTIEQARGNREWKDAVAGFYYIKPNYPGHSSHICNAGFVTLASVRGRGLGYALGESFLHYAPLLGYRGSVFNLVYADNPASIKIWDKLGFTRIGLVPGAGKRVRKRESDGMDEEYYVDAHIIFKSFV